MLHLTASIRESKQMAESLKDLRLEQTFDIQIEQLSTDTWILGTMEEDHEDLIEEITTTLIQAGLREFELTFCEDK